VTRAAATLLVAVLLGICICGSLATGRVEARGQSVGAREVAEAVAIGAGRDEAREAFHAPYVLRLGGPVLQSLEIVTEFRRVVLLAEERVRQGNVGWDAESASVALAPHRGRLDLILQLRFSPQNTYRSMPPVDASIYERGGSRVQPLNVQARPANLAGPVPPAGTPILAGTVEATFAASALDFGRSYLVGIFLDGRELERIPLDLSSLR